MNTHSLYATLKSSQTIHHGAVNELFICSVDVGVLLTGCVSTGTLKARDCQTTDWQTLGYQDGVNGENAQKILRYTHTCQGQTPPNRMLWEQGRQEGLSKYCTKANAYNLGRMGRTLNAVCEDNLEELHHANIMGLQQYEVSERINRLYYGYGFEPWIPYYPYWFW